MKLKNYLNERGRASNLAREICVSKADISNWSDGKRLPPIRHCVAIERATGGAVTRKDLRPKDWADIWPELAEKGE